MKERFKDKQYLLDGLTIFPASFVVTLTDLNLSSEVQKEIMQLDFVKKITSRDDTMKTLVTLGNGIRIASGIILLLLVLISIFIISNTIKLTVHSRRKEISIMKYVGATNSFIRWPFMIEGIIIGIFAAVLSTIFVGLSYNTIADKIMQSELSTMININLLGFRDMFQQVFIVYLMLGIGVGVIGSVFSMKKYLDV